MRRTALFAAGTGFVLAALMGRVGASETSEPASEQTLPTIRVEAAIIPSIFKTDTPVRDVPQSVSVIDRQLIDDLNMQNIGDAMLYVPGAGMAQGEGNRETPVLRGNSSTGDFFLDGLRDDVQYYRDLYNIERVEVLKGPNGMLFGRGGIGGIVNRVSKEAGWSPVRQWTVQAGSHQNKRTSLDIGGAVDESLAMRVNAMYEDSESYRDDVTLERYGINPTLTWRTGTNTRVALGVEYFHDERVADRGVSSFQGRPLNTRAGAFFGDPAQSPTHATVKLASAVIEHSLGEMAILRNRSRFGDYDKFYQNVFPGAVSGDGSMVEIRAYNNATQRRNLFNQTDLNVTFDAAGIRHDLLAGLELGRQETDNFRNTGYFDSVAVGTAVITVPVSDPRTTLPVSFRQSATDADNNGVAKIAALYVQDEIWLSQRWLAVAGLRYDRFEVDFRNNRNGQRFNTTDEMVSPRVGLIYKPVEAVSVYASYSRTFQPRAGDQLSSLSASNESLDPEEFSNYEVGVKWDAGAGFELSAAVFRLERSNVAVPDPADPVNSILIDGQRTQGVEFGVNGRITPRWSIVGAYAWQDGEILADQSATILKGATLANLPAHTASLWNRYDLSQSWAFGLGIVMHDELFAATENLANPQANVTLPGYTRVDGAVYYTPNERWRIQLNLENLLDEDYFQFAHNNTNITPGSPRAARMVFTLTF